MITHGWRHDESLRRWQYIVDGGVAYALPDAQIEHGHPDMLIAKLRRLNLPIPGPLAEYLRDKSPDPAWLVEQLRAQLDAEREHVRCDHESLRELWAYSRALDYIACVPSYVGRQLREIMTGSRLAACEPPPEPVLIGINWYDTLGADELPAQPGDNQQLPAGA